MLKKIICCVFLFVCISASADEFVIHKIRVTGLERVSYGTVLSYLPIKEGDRVDSSQSADIIHDLYQTGFFSDVKLSENDGDLIIAVTERPVIGTVNIAGNKKVTKKQLQDALKTAGIVEGQAFDQANLTSFAHDLVQQYYSMGVYNINVNTSTANESKNRVGVNVTIYEGDEATIREIKIIGNHAFSQNVLLGEFTSTTPKIWSFISHSDQYSKEKLDADLEKLRSYYLDRGYLRFKIDSTQVSITPDKAHIYITINVTEGPIYHISGYTLDGDFIGKRNEMVKLITLKNGDEFSRRNIVDIESALTQFYGDYGYGMPDIKIDTDVNDQTRQVLVRFVTHPGKRVYVRRINFVGNTKTHDDVLRREMRQQEGALFSLSKINESKRRLSNLGYLQDVDFKVNPVAGHPDQVDLDYNVKETSSESANFQAGYSDADGFLYGISLTEQNFLGTGKAVSIGFDNSKSLRNYNLSYYNPYYTTNNISLLVSAYLQQNDPGAINLSSYDADILGASVTYGFPFSDYNRLNLGYGVERTHIGTNSMTSTAVTSFISSFGNVFNEAKLLAGWTYSNFDRARFPTSGFAHSLNLEFGAPLDKNSITYYKAEYNISYYHPIIKSFIFHARGDAGYGNGIGKVGQLPFFKNFFAGGIDTVRGFENGTLGPWDNYNNPLGGNVTTTASASVIFPNPVGESLRTSAFVDVGNVYENTFNFGDLRSSVGVQFEWQTPIAPLVFALAKPIRSKTGDNIDMFQFSVSTSL